MTYREAFKKAAAWWDPTSWGSDTKTKTTQKSVDDSYGFDFKTTPIDQYKPSNSGYSSGVTGTTGTSNAAGSIAQSSRPTYTSALDRAKAIRSRVDQANAVGEAERQKELEQRTTMRTMLNSTLNEAVGGMDSEAAEAAAQRNMSATRNQVAQEMNRKRYGAAANAPTVAQYDTRLRAQQANNPYGSFANASTMSYTPGVTNRQQQPSTWNSEYQQAVAMRNVQPTQTAQPAKTPTYAQAYETANNTHIADMNRRTKRRSGNAYFNPVFQNRLPSRSI